MRGRRMGRAVRLVLVGLALAVAVRPVAGQGQNVRVVGQIGGVCEAVFVEGNYAYIGEGVNLTILDVANPSAPVALARLRLPDIVQGVFVSGGLAYVAGGLSGLQIIDVTNPTAPTLRGSYDTTGTAYGVFVSGGLAYVADGYAGLQIIDVMNPASPQLRGTYDTPYAALAVYVSGNVAYVADGYAGLQIIDVTNPSSPTLSGSFDTPYAALAVYVSGGLAYVAEVYSAFPLSWTLLQIIDVTNPSSPTLRGSFDTPGRPYGLSVSGGLAYVADDFSGLQIIDVTNPSSPTLRGAFDTAGTARGVFVSGALAYVADLWSGLQVIDVTNPSSPTLRGAFDTLDAAQGVFASGNLAYVADGRSGLQIIDVTNPSLLTLRGSFDTSSYAGGVFVSGGLAYVADDFSGLQIIDVTNPSSPTLRGSFDTSDYARGVFVSGGLAYVADDFSGLQIIDVTNPSSPTLRGAFDTPGYAQGVYVSGGLAYVADEGSGLQIIDVTNPSSPTLRGSYDTPSYAYGVFVSGNLAYVADYWSGLQIIDVTNPSSPTLRGAYDTPGYASGVFVSGNLAYVADGESGLRIIDVANPSLPTLRGAYDTPGYASGVFVSGGLAYVADGSGGLWILRYTPEPPRIQAATLSDVNNTGAIEAGDQVVLTLDRGVQVTTSVLRASHFFLPVAGDSLGGVGFAVDVNPYNSRQIVLTLGTGVHLTAAGQFTTATVTAGSPSGIDFASSLPATAIVSFNGVPATDGGVPGLDDFGVDVQLSLIGAARDIGTSGGNVTVVDSPNAAYRRHALVVPAGALATTTTFRLRPPVENLGVINAVQIESSSPTVTFATPATVRIEYREGDIDWERGQVEAEMRVHQLVQDSSGRRRYVPVATAQSLDPTSRLVSVEVRSLSPHATSGTVGIFAGLPVETVDERTIHIAPQGGAGGIAPEQGEAALTPGLEGSYKLHKIEFPGYVETTTTDPLRLVVTIRTAALAERQSLGGGQSFPGQSGAVFVVTVRNASGQPVPFPAPVHITLQFKARSAPLPSDCVTFGGQTSGASSMRLVFDQQTGAAVDFGVVSGPAPAINVPQGTLRMENVAGLTGADGLGTWGAVGYVPPAARVAGHWPLYR